jgi:hypothetical protein
VGYESFVPSRPAPVPPSLAGRMTGEDKAGKGGGDGKAGEHKGRASKFTEAIKSTVKRSASLLSPKKKDLKKGKLMFTFR